LITGASRGIGHEIALQFAEKIGSGSLIFLIARNKTGLDDAKSKIEKNLPGKCTVLTLSYDLHNVDSQEYLNAINSALKEAILKPDDFEQSMLVHNAGSVDCSKYASEQSDGQAIQKYYGFNVVSPQVLTWAFLQLFKTNRMIINLTSKAGVMAFKGMSLYCSGKACRDMYFQVMAEEDPSLLILNYAPGPVDTDMYAEASKSRDADIRKCFEDSKTRGEVLTCQQTVTKLIKLLEEKKFKSGAHIDYFDKDL